MKNLNDIQTAFNLELFIFVILFFKYLQTRFKSEFVFFLSVPNNLDVT